MIPSSDARAAHNPYSVPTDPDINRAAHERLLTGVRARGLPHLAVTGSSPDGRWQEPSVAVTAVNSTDGTTMAAWARSLGKHAFFECTDEHLVVVGADGRPRRTRLRRRG